MHFTVLYLSILLFPMSFYDLFPFKGCLSSCSQKPLGVPQGSASAHVTYLYWKLFHRHRFESYLRSHVLLVGKNCHGSRETRTAKQYGMPAAWPFNFPFIWKQTFYFELVYKHAVLCYFLDNRIVKMGIVRI